MQAEEHFQKLVNMFEMANINQHVFKNAKLTITHGTSTLTWTVDDALFHAVQSLHGAAYFKLLDDAAYFAAAAAVTDNFIVTTSFNLNFFRPVHKGIITATGKLTFASKNMWVASSEAKDDRGRIVASGTGNFSKSATPLSKAPGYL